MDRKNVILWDVMPVALVRTDVLEGHIASIIRVTRISELGQSISLQRASVAAYC
jgi:hypothetical protein